MVTIHREAGFRFVIYTNDHEPAHVHVQGEGMMKVAIRGASGLPEIIEAIAIKARDRRRAMEVIRDRQDEFLALWQAIQERRP